MLAITAILMACVTIPYVFAERSAGDGFVFGGFLLNPLDGNSYLAKMGLGWRGDWLFSLPYTAEKGQGALLFFPYILLGHLARNLGMSLIFTFHAVRVISAGVMSLAIYRLLTAYLPPGNAPRLATLIASFGSGLGWLMLPFGTFTSDFWVAEAYPFLSAYANPHFPLSLALLIFLLMPVAPMDKGRKWGIAGAEHPLYPILGVILASLALALLSPFAVVIVLVIWSALAMWEIIQSYYLSQPIELSGMLSRLGWIALGGLPVLVYDLVVISSDPLLSAWNAQNLTPTTPPWDVLASLSPVLLLLPFGVQGVLSEGGRPRRLLVVWVIVCLALLYIPWGLQRRFMMGIYVPISALAATGVARLAGDGRRFWFWGAILFVLVLPTNLLVNLAALHGMQTHDERLYLTRDESAALAWIEANTQPDAIILASPEMGMFIPAQTGRRVVYGHPFETVRAEEQKSLVEGFLRGDTVSNSQAMLDRIDYVFYGPRERAIGQNSLLASLRVVYQNPSVVVYSAR